MELLREDYVKEVRRGRVQYGDVFQSVLKRSATCRCCGEKMPKGANVIRFSWDFKGCGSWTVVECVMHAKPCEPLRRTSLSGGEQGTAA